MSSLRALELSGLLAESVALAALTWLTETLSYPHFLPKVENGAPFELLSRWFCHARELNFPRGLYLIKHANINAVRRCVTGRGCLEGGLQPPWRPSGSTLDFKVLKFSSSLSHSLTKLQSHRM